MLYLVKGELQLGKISNPGYAWPQSDAAIHCGYSVAVTYWDVRSSPHYFLVDNLTLF